MYMAFWILGLAAIAGDPVKTGLQHEEARLLLKNELTQVFSIVDASNVSTGDLAGVKLMTHADGSVELLDVSAASEQKRAYIKEQIAQMHLDSEDVIPDAIYTLRLRFEVR